MYKPINFSAVIPGKTLNEVNKIISDSFEPIKIGISKNQALFEMDNCKIVTRVLDGEFLNYSNVIPSEWDTRIRVNKNILQSCFERISLISSSSVEKEKKYPVKVTVDIGKLTISCANQTGDAKEEIYVSTEGKNIEAGFNPKYFLDALKVIDDEEVFVHFGSSISPCVIRPVDEGDYVYMVLPIRLKITKSLILFMCICNRYFKKPRNLRKCILSGTLITIENFRNYTNQEIILTRNKCYLWR